MSKRLQVLIQDEEYRLIQKQAREANLTVGEWVRHMLRKMQRDVSVKSPQQKLKAIQTAAKHSFPIGDIEQVLAEIEMGYSEGSLDSH